MSALSDKIKKAGLNRVPAEVPEWSDVLNGAQLYIRELTGAERGELEATMSDPKKADIGKLRLKLVALTLVDEGGDQVFGGPGEVADLAGSVVGRLSDRALEVSGFTESALDDAVKN